jgi:hypothetical protein
VARGFESKSVADQQQDDFHRPEPRAEGVSPELERQRRGLELARADVRARLAAGPGEAHRRLLESSLAAIERQLADLVPPA